MSRLLNQRLYSIHISCDAIIRYTAGLGFAEFRRSAMARDAVDRRLDMVGEALLAARDLDPARVDDTPEVRRILALHRRLVDGDVAIADGSAFAALRRDAPVLRAMAAALLASAHDALPAAPGAAAATLGPDGVVIDPLAGTHEAIAALCRQYGVARLDVFGSAVKGTFNPELSDLDFVVTFEDRGLVGYSARYLGLADDLETLFGRNVDLIVDEAIRNPYFREEIEVTRKVVYVAPDETLAA
ncbi:MAG: nucleotidyltransferase domain-containing protein [Thermomicrobiales bacterium]